MGQGQPRSSFEQDMMSPKAQCYIPSHNFIGSLVLEVEILKGFYHTWACGILGNVTQIPKANFRLQSDLGIHRLLKPVCLKNFMVCLYCLDGLNIFYQC